MYSPVKSRKSRKKSPTAKKTKKRTVKSKKTSKIKSKSKTEYTISTPTSLSAFPDKSPQLQHPEKTPLNLKK